MHIDLKQKLFKMVKSFAPFLLSICIVFQTTGQPTTDYVSVLKSKGEEPIQFTLNSLKRYDLIIFDDAVHSAQEPFDFYRALIQNSEFHKKVKYIFVELFSIASQEQIDQYLNSPVEDSTLLLTVFQDNFSGFGNRYQTYLDLLKTVRKSNEGLHISEQLKVIGVDQPIFWSGIKSTKDYNDFNNSLDARDYFMYRQIVHHLNYFHDGQKAIFLTNTRHAYKNLKSNTGSPIWNCATFFYQWHKGKSCSVRIHNANLYVEYIREDVKQKSIEGIEKVVFKWIKADSGKWDEAFAINKNKPVGIFLDQTPFGKSPYIGNQMLSAMKSQTMADVYDAVIFLAPLDQLHFSAEFNFICTSDFKAELQRRIRIIYGDNVSELLKEQDVQSLEELVEKVCVNQPIRKNNLIR